MTLPSSRRFAPMRSVLSGFLACIALAGPLSAQGHAGAIQSSVGAGLAVMEEEAGYRVERPDGSFEPLEVPARTRLSAFVELDDGWLAAGDRWTEDGRELVLLRKSGFETELLESPPSEEPALRHNPVPLVKRGALEGLAWLEGDGGEKNAVMAAGWTAGSWGVVETVSPHTGEAQLGLTGAVLDDGRLLLAWAAVDDEDDEILWSRFDGGQWSPPVRAHADNRVPDITPRLAAVEGGALLAWSQDDGRDYRLKIARLDGDAWADTGFSSEAGGLFPSVFPTSGGVGFLYLAGPPRGWSLLQVEAGGRIAARAAMPEATRARPMVTSLGPAIVLRFPGGLSSRVPPVGPGKPEETLEWEWLP